MLHCKTKLHSTTEADSVPISQYKRDVVSVRDRLSVMPCQTMSMVVVHVASGTRDILVFWAAWPRLLATPYTLGERYLIAKTLPITRRKKRS